MGDFNVALNMEDSYSGSSFMDSAMCEFKDCVKNIEVFDINSFGIHFTWNRKPKGRVGVLKKLDQIMGNLDFVDVVHKMKSLKKHFRKLLHEQGNLHDRVNRLRTELDEAFNDAKIDEERFLRQKAKIEWLEMGDSNLAYLHKTIKRLNQRSHIDVIITIDNVEVTGNQISNIFVSNYKSFLGTNMACDELDCEGLFHKKVFELSNETMTRPVTNEEIKRAMFGIGDDKSPGPDGFTPVFFKKGCDVVRHDVCHVVRDFFVNGKLLKEINHTFLALILKVTIPLKVTDYRPISCCNVIYKCISKILTNRIIEGVKEVVSDNQSAFIPGRRISDNILITRSLCITTIVMEVL
ncbi:protein LAZ1 [Tanacetum coccineum]